MLVDLHAAQSSSAFLLRRTLQQSELPHSPRQPVEAAEPEVSRMNHALVWLLLSVVVGAFALITELIQHLVL